MAENRLNEIRGKALDRVERSERNLKLGTIAFAILDTAFFITFLLVVGCSRRLPLLIFVASGGSCMLLLRGMLVRGVLVRRGATGVARD